jgi:prevent-host-death family protein
MVGLDPTTQSLDFLCVNVHKNEMRAILFSDFRKNIAANLDKVNDDCEPVIITRSNGKPAAVLMSIDHFASFENRIDRSPVSLTEVGKTNTEFAKNASKS